jgi:hypothetical protein
MIRILITSAVIGVSVVESVTYSQSLFSPRAIAIGAYGPLVNDTRSFTDNPAGIVEMRDWDLSVATYLPTGQKSSGFVFQGISLGKKLFDDAAVALQYSQGSALEFVIPATFVRLDSAPVSVDKRIQYDEPFAAAVAYKPAEGFSVGISGRLLKQKITDTQYQLVVDSTGGGFKVLPDKISEIDVTNFDIGLRWKPTDIIGLSVVGRNIVRLESGTFPDDLESYELSDKKFLDVGASVVLGSVVTVSVQYSTANEGAVGGEWLPGSGLAIRTGLYMSGDGSPFVSAIGAGIGWRYKFFTADAAYLGFTSQADRSGTSLVGQFEPSSITRMGLNAYTGDRVQLSLTMIFGNVRTSLANIEGVEMLGGIYPSAYEASAYRPIGKARVKNVSDQPIEARVRFYIERYMDDPTESQPVHILSGETQEIPITAVFNDQVKRVEQMIVREGSVYVSATPAEEYDDKYAMPVLIHGRNDWDGSVYSLRYFVTPNDPTVIRYTRDILLHDRDSLNKVSPDIEPFTKAKILFNAFAGKLVYINDPKQSADNVQYPSETLQLRGGDCDDMTTCFSSLLNSVGISTAFVDVIPPEDSSKSHIYLMFDSGLNPKFGDTISSNAKRYVTRKNAKGLETVWIPIETTVMSRGFDAAWSQGAQQYFDDVEVGLGLIKGWVKIVDVY